MLFGTVSLVLIAFMVLQPQLRSFAIGRSPRCLRRQLGGPTLFLCRYFKDISYSLDNCSSLGPFIVAGSVIA